MSTILLATDFSECALLAMDRAVQLTKHIGENNLDVVNVQDEEELSSLMSEYEIFSDLREQVAKGVKEEFSDVTSQIQNHLSLAFHVRFGVSHIEVAEEAKERKSGLIVAGTRGFLGGGKFYIGSFTSRLLRSIRTPILAVRNPVKSGYKSVLVPVEFTDMVDFQIEQAQKYADEGATIILLHVNEVAGEGLLRYASVSDNLVDEIRGTSYRRSVSKLNEIAEKFSDKFTVRVLVVNGNPADEILDFIQNNTPDLVVAGKRGSGVVSYLVGSVTRRLLLESESDVLVCLSEDYMD